MAPMALHSRTKLATKLSFLCVPDKVAGGEADLKIGSKEVGGGEAEGIDGGTLEDELRLCRAEDEPYNEDGGADGNYEADCADQEVNIDLLLSFVVAAIFLHVLVRKQGLGEKNGSRLCLKI
ncbi:Hypothetical predicted protein [Olea europaea subsp. europaea]|uniref:Uncharacterized protein n=1 Tax=Olea europaea subsp. europaea TaxID=158383 RepID=A0A8S0S484_OLEEU|nr:Hypothetical predicted protein [Olea europaea subsp. europaea]